jgi:glycosidase
MKTTSWGKDAIFYHIYPLGLCGAPFHNDYNKPAVARLDALHNWVDHIGALGCNAIYLGPLFESGTHGYDTADYYKVDRRLGTNESLKSLVRKFHEKDIRVILDGVFNHVGRDFWAFQDLLRHGANSSYRDWFAGVDFERQSPYGDAFAYEGWNGHHSLVKLNLHHPDVRAHLFDAVKMWIDVFEIDGLRLDAADVIDLGFLRDLATFCRQQTPSFWLIGEVIHGDYRRWINEGGLDATTNYECYKGLYSSHNDKNYFEIAYSLNRLFGEHGIYKNFPLYSFADNHDVNRVASTLTNPAHLLPLYTLLYTMPGTPSVYYGSEWGIQGRKESGSDAPLRPRLQLPQAKQQALNPQLEQVIKQLARIREEHPALRYGSYRQTFVTNEQFAFTRQTEQEQILVVVNAADTTARLRIPLNKPDGTQLTDLLQPQQKLRVQQGHIQLDQLQASGARIMVAD